MIKNIVFFILCMTPLIGVKLTYGAINDPIPYYHLSSNYPMLVQREAIQIIASPQHRQRLRLWLDDIAQTDKGRQTLLSIILSGHQLTIQHSRVATLSAGRTIAPMTENLINGKGENVRIIFDFAMPTTGTHKVYNQKMHLIEFNAPQNLYHELAHAMHQMNGTWRYFASEKQAIEEENIFRQQLAAIQNKKPTRRDGKQGVLIDNSPSHVQFDQRPP